MILAVSSTVAERDPSGFGGFDFLYGDWSVKNRKLKRRLVGENDWREFPGHLSVRPILGGGGNMDELTLDDPAGASRGSSIRLYDAATKIWSIYWIDSRSPVIEPPVKGRMIDGVATLTGDENYNGRMVRVRFIYENLTPTTGRWSQAYSIDGERSWETNWVMDFTRL